MNIKKRTAYRVDTTLSIGWRPLSQSTANLDALRDLNSHITKLLNASRQSSEIKQIAQALNHKMDFIWDHVTGAARQRRQLPVNISAAGVAFYWDECVELGARIEVNLVLPKILSPVSIKSKVVECTPVEGKDNEWYFRCAFLPEQDSAIDVVVGYVNILQSEELAKRRQD